MGIDTFLKLNSTGNKQKLLNIKKKLFVSHSKKDSLKVFDKTVRIRIHPKQPLLVELQIVPVTDNYSIPNCVNL
jgi:hypothetical protein